MGNLWSLASVKAVPSIILRFYKSISFDEAISQNLRIMDGTALTLAKDHKLPIKVFNLKYEDSLSSIVKGEEMGTLIS
jgi:uridylate kinase